MRLDPFILVYLILTACFFVFNPTRAAYQAIECRAMAVHALFSSLSSFLVGGIFYIEKAFTISNSILGGTALAFWIYKHH